MVMFDPLGIRSMSDDESSPKKQLEAQLRSGLSTEIAEERSERLAQAQAIELAHVKAGGRLLVGGRAVN
jgi:hypothetical protein